MPKSKWQIRINEGPLYWQDFVNASWPNVISRIRVVKYPVENVLEVYCRDYEFIQRCANISSDIRTECEQKNLSLAISHAKTIDFGPFYASINATKANQETTIRFVQMLREFEDIDDEVFNRILIELEVYKTESKIAEEINQLMDSDSLDNVKEACDLAKDAQNNGYYELIWELAKSLNETVQEGMNSSIPLALKVDIFASIAEKNPHFKDANVELFGLLTPNDSILSEEEFLEKKLRIAVKSSQQQLINQSFNQLAGNSICQMTMPLVGDENTLVFLAKQLRSLRQENEMLKYQAKNAAAKTADKSNITSIWQRKEEPKQERATFVISPILKK